MSTQLSITPLNNLPLLKRAQNLSNKGQLRASVQNLIYLDIDDAYIHALFPLLDHPNIQKPDYFSCGIGAHISVVYPKEHQQVQLNTEDFTFNVEQLMMAQTLNTTYFALTVTSPALLAFRKKYQLSESLLLDHYQLPFHITLAKQLKGNSV